MSVESVVIKVEPFSYVEGSEEAPAEPSPLTNSTPEFIDIKLEPTVNIKVDDGPEDCASKEAHKEFVLFEHNVQVKLEALDESDEEDRNNMMVEVSPFEMTQNMETKGEVKTEHIEILNIPIVPLPGARPPQNEGKFACPICQKTFVNRQNQQRHTEIHSRSVYTCEICSKQFNKHDKLEKHMMIHNKRFECNICSKVFKSSSNLFQHKRIHLEKKPFSCEQCDRTFSTRANYLKHVNSTGRRCKKKREEPLTCNVCHKEFEKEFLLKSHLRRHTTEKPFNCELCDMHFKYKSTLIRHLQWHNGERPYSCKYCDKTFTHAGLVKPHLRTHTGEKPYQCPSCLKRFTHKHNMQRHQLRHNKVKFTTCEVCHKEFPKESRLKYHMRIHSADNKPFHCLVCPKKFSHRQNVLRHYTRKHPNETYDCTDTDASMADKVWFNVVQKWQVKTEPDEILP